MCVCVRLEGCPTEQGGSSARACVERAADVSTVSSRAGICARGSLVFQGRGDGETAARWSGVAGQRGHRAKATPERDGDAARRRGSRVQRARSDLLAEGHASVCEGGRKALSLASARVHTTGSLG